MRNLLEETFRELQEHGHAPEDVIWCGSKDFGHFSWEVFTKLANKNYDNGFGSREVARDLVVVGKDWWLERFEYDGSEHWEYKRYPPLPFSEATPITLFIKDYNGEVLLSIQE